MHVIWGRGGTPTHLAWVIVPEGVQKIRLQVERVPQTVSSGLLCVWVDHVQVSLDHLFWDDAGTVSLK